MDISITLCTIFGLLFLYMWLAGEGGGESYIDWLKRQPGITEDVVKQHFFLKHRFSPVISFVLLMSAWLEATA